MKIISGGQSGVDRAALDFALKNDISCGGWCPKGRIAEDGVIDSKYPLKETRTHLYVVRTKLNVDEADGTLVLYSNELGNGSAFTAEYAVSKKKKLLVLNINNVTGKKQVIDWLTINKIKTLNIAGPRESTSPGIYTRTIRFLEIVFSELN